MRRATLLVPLVSLLSGCEVSEPECLKDGECAAGEVCVGNLCAVPYTGGPLGVRQRADGRTGPGKGATFVTETTGTSGRPGAGTGGSTGGSNPSQRTRWIQVDLCPRGCSVKPGIRDDPAAGESVLVSRAVTLPDPEVSHPAVLSCVRSLLGYTGAQISSSPPPAGTPYRRVIVTTSAELLGRSSYVKGLASTRCSSNEHTVAFVFSQGAGLEPRLVCEEIARQVGFTAGLDVVTDCADVMSGPERCSSRTFRDRESSCGELQERRCCFGGPKQNSHDRLREMLNR